jgi:CRISPR-associated protein Cas2
MMRNRFMRTMVFFDLPNIYSKDKKNYLKFRKFLINEGFIMMQESVYSKIVLNSQQSQLLMNRIKRNAPKKGFIQVLTITERQYAHIENIIGENPSKIINDDSRLVIL